MTPIRCCVRDRVQRAVREEIEDKAPEKLTEQDRDLTEKAILQHTNHILDALSLDEMQSEFALLRHVADARAEAVQLVHEQICRERQSLTPADSKAPLKGALSSGGAR